MRIDKQKPHKTQELIRNSQTEKISYSIKFVVCKKNPPNPPYRGSKSKDKKETKAHAK